MSQHDLGTFGCSRHNRIRGTGKPEYRGLVAGKKALWTIPLLCFVIVFSPYCGKKGPPVIPQLVSPLAPSDLKAHMDCNRIALTFLLPTLNNDGSVIENLESVQIFRKRSKAKISERPPITGPDQDKGSSQSSLDVPAGPDKAATPGPDSSPAERGLTGTMSAERGFSRGVSFKDQVDKPYQELAWLPHDKKFSKVAEYDLQKLSQSEEAGFIQPDLYPAGQAPFRCHDYFAEGTKPLQHAEGYVYEYHYRIRVINSAGEYSPFSNVARVLYAVPAAAPSDITWRQESDTLHIVWDPPTTLCNGQNIESELLYNVYFRKKNSSYSGKALNNSPLSTSSYTLENIEQDTIYFCVIHAVTLNPYCESLASEEKQLILQDRAPPGPPQNLIAIAGFNLVSLLWEAPKDRDILGYNVYRQTDTHSAEWSKINEEIIERTTYVDRSIDMSQAYFYAVTSVDSSPQKNESQRSSVQKVLF